MATVSHPSSIPPVSKELYSRLSLRWIQLGNNYTTEQIQAWGELINRRSAGELDDEQLMAAHLLIFG